MRALRRGATVACAIVACGIASPRPGNAAARVVRVSAAEGAAAAALAAAVPGQEIVLEPGVHHGPLQVSVPRLVLRGEPGAIVDGGGAGTVITVTAPEVTIESLSVRASGRSVGHVDAAVRVLQSAGVTLRGLTASDVLYGVNAERAVRLEVRDCSLLGRVSPLDESGDGNGLHLWYCSDVLLAGNRVGHFLDAIYFSFTNRARVVGNRIAGNGRYGLHTMYSQSDRLERNLFTGNSAGCALMFSNQLVVEGNRFVRNRGSRTYGLLLRDCSGGTFTGNQLSENTVAVFMDGSNRNRFRGNWVERNGWGLILFSSCAGNEFAGNAFVQNDVPVALDMRFTSNRFDDGTAGNYWSGSGAFDLDGDGVGDVAFSPVSAFAFVSKQYPDLALLTHSPAVAALGIAERVFPAMHPSEAVDHHPLVRAPAPPSVESAASPPPAGARGSAVAATGFGSLFALGLLGLVRGGRGARPARKAAS